MDIPGYVSEKAFQRRIKRHVKAAEQRLVVKVVPAFAETCGAELASLGFSRWERTDSGIELTGRLEDVYTLNLKLQTASRILLEIASFKAGAREELFRKSLNVPWELYVNPLLPLSVKARVIRSRLRHEGQTVETFCQALERRFADRRKGQPITYAGSDPEPERQRLEIIVVNNRCRILADSTGKHLHRRRYREAQVKAPIRETLAAGFLKWAFAGRPAPAAVIDPACGSGTLLLESWLHVTGRPPGIRRDFLFAMLPWHQDATWRYLKASADSNRDCRLPDLCGGDLSPKNLQTARENRRAIGAGRAVRFIRHDCLEAAPEAYGAGVETGWIIVNPPYGVRLEEGTRTFLTTMMQRFRTAFPGWTAALILPSWFATGKTWRALRMKPAKTVRFSNGGIPVAGTVFQF